MSSDNEFPIVDQSVGSGDEGVAILSAALYFLIASIMLFVSINHSYKLYQDFFTKERKSVTYSLIAKVLNVDQPELTAPYKLYNVLALLAIYFYFLSSIAGVLNHAAQTNEQCDIAITALICFSQIAKTFQYLVYLVKLYRIFKVTDVGRKTLILCCAIFSILYGIAMIIVTISVIAQEVVVFGSYPNWCKVTSDIVSSAYAYSAVGVIIKDIIMVFVIWVVFYYVYQRPAQEATEEMASKDKTYVSKQVLAYTLKLKVLVFGSLVSTLVLLILTVTISGMVQIPLGLLNSLCIAFLTDYYSDQSYQRVCCVCIKFTPEIKLPPNDKPQQELEQRTTEKETN